MREGASLRPRLLNARMEAAKKFRSLVLEPLVGCDNIRGNCSIGGSNQIGIFGWRLRSHYEVDTDELAAEDCDDATADGADQDHQTATQLDETQLDDQGTFETQQRDPRPVFFFFFENSRDAARLRRGVWGRR